MRRLLLLGAAVTGLAAPAPASASALERDCGTVQVLDFARASVEANRYTATCNKARRIARQWSRYQQADNGVHPMVKFSTPVRILGFRCSGARSLPDGGIAVRCRRKKARVRWEWGD
jgi:phospholipase/lecithinase/hemolysin